jgi:2-hydroxychromene-2-carboxylate isomerase
VTKTLEFFFDVGSPAAYLAFTQLPALAEQTGAELIYRPMLLGGVFHAIGNRTPMAIPAKGRYLFQDLSRYASRYGVPLMLCESFPINTLTLMRIAAALHLRSDDRFLPYVSAIYQALFGRGANLGDPATVQQTLQDAGLDSDALLAMASEEPVKAHLKSATEEAVARGVFGAPTMFVGREMFFGQDRLEFVREALR